MNQLTRNTRNISQGAPNMNVALKPKAALLSLLLGIPLLGTTISANAENECGPGPVVTCAPGNYTSGITYDFSSDLSLTTNGQVGVGGAAFGLRLNGSGSAGVTLTTATSRVWGVGGIHVTLGSGNLDAEINGDVTDTTSSINRNSGTGCMSTLEALPILGSLVRRGRVRRLRA